MSEESDLIIHTPCGLPVELCECPNPPVSYDWENDAFRDNGGETPAEDQE